MSGRFAWTTKFELLFCFFERAGVLRWPTRHNRNFQGGDCGHRKFDENIKHDLSRCHFALANHMAMDSGPEIG